jgi:hypothetical protein
LLKIKRFSLLKLRIIARIFVSFTAVTILCWTALAQSEATTDNDTIEKKLAICFVTKDDQQRLRCYDTSIKQEFDKYKNQQDVIRQEWQGSGLQTTRPFHMPGSWEFQWESAGFFQVMLYHRGESAGEAFPTVIANQLKAGSGKSYVDSGGDYYLVINAMESWSAKAVLVNQ